MASRPGAAPPARWLTAETLTGPRSYSVAIAPGLYLSAAIARMQTESPGMGSFRFDVAGLSCMQLGEEHLFGTRLDTGDVRTLGLRLADDGSDADGETILRLLGAGTRIRAATDVPVHLVAGLCRPLDPWFAGTARALALEARHLELKATILGWLGRRSPGPGHRHHGFAVKARSIIEDDLGADLSIAVLARRVGLNARSLTEAFRAAFGDSIATYVARRRLDFAIGQLANGWSVNRTAQAVGYTPAYFSTAFQRRFGVTPRSARSIPEIEEQSPDI